jgi:hypothetical protein
MRAPYIRNALVGAFQGSPSRASRRMWKCPTGTGNYDGAAPPRRRWRMGGPALSRAAALLLLSGASHPPTPSSSGLPLYIMFASAHRKTFLKRPIKINSQHLPSELSIANTVIEVGLVSPSRSSPSTSSMQSHNAHWWWLLTPKISGPFWWILGLKYVLIDMWANDQNEMIFFYFQL